MSRNPCLSRRPSSPWASVHRRRRTAGCCVLVLSACRGCGTAPGRVGGDCLAWPARHDHVEYGAEAGHVSAGLRPSGPAVTANTWHSSIRQRRPPARCCTYPVISYRVISGAIGRAWRCIAFTSAAGPRIGESRRGLIFSFRPACASCRRASRAFQPLERVGNITVKGVPSNWRRIGLTTVECHLSADSQWSEPAWPMAATYNGWK